MQTEPVVKFVGRLGSRWRVEHHGPTRPGRARLGSAPVRGCAAWSSVRDMGWERPTTVLNRLRSAASPPETRKAGPEP
jgi:hypothetical protein